jgi:glycosyltransferase 2 family protein
MYQWLGWLALLLIIPGLIFYAFVVKKWFPSFVGSFYPTLWMGIGVQLLQIICIYGIMQSIGINHHFFEFQLLFLLSSIVAIFPFTIGGLGARELVFLWGAQEFGLLQTEAVFISLLFYLITVLVSLVGVIWVFKEPLRRLDNQGQLA